MCVSHFACFSVFFAIFQVRQCVCLIFHVFRFFPHIPGPSVYIFDFPHFPVFLFIFQILPCVFLIFHVFHLPCHIPGPTMCISHLVFSIYSMSYSVCFSFSTFFYFPCHMSQDSTGSIVLTVGLGVCFLSEVPGLLKFENPLHF